MKSKTSKEIPDESLNDPDSFGDTHEVRAPDIITMLNEVETAREEAVEIGLTFEAYLLHLAVLALSEQADAKIA